MSLLSAFDLRQVLNWPLPYQSFMRLLGADAAMRRWVNEVVRPEPGQRLLDIGCGPASLRDFLPDVEYVGIDHNASYLAKARMRFPQADFEQVDLEENWISFPHRDFDLITACGLLHHLSDDAAQRLFANCRGRLRVGGRLVTLDCVRRPGQSRTARLLSSLDRGRFVRSASEYIGLAQSVFTDVGETEYVNLLRIPYCHIALECE